MNGLSMRSVACAVPTRTAPSTGSTAWARRAKSAPLPTLRSVSCSFLLPQARETAQARRLAAETGEQRTARQFRRQAGHVGRQAAAARQARRHPGQAARHLLGELLHLLRARHAAAKAATKPEHVGEA